MSIHAKADNCAQLVSVMGKVDVLRKSNVNGEDVNSGDERQTIKYSIPADLLCTDVIVTRQASRAKLKLPSTIMTLSPNSRVFVSQITGKKMEENVVNLTYGKMRSFFKGKKLEYSEKTSGLKVKTPSAVAGIRGTDFYIGYDPNTQITEQATLTGRVEVEQIATKKKIEVPSGKQVNVAEEKPLEIKTIEPETIKDIQQTSVLAKTESVFQSKEAVEIIGEPEKWVAPANEKLQLPSKFNDLENKF